MSIKSQLKRSVYAVLSRDNQGSHATRADRRNTLMRCAEELVGLGYKIASIQQLKEKHIVALVQYWKQNALSTGTLKNRLAAIRHLTTLINKSGIVPSNKTLDLGHRHSIAMRNRAIYAADFSKITDPHVKISLELQRVFGLRREESIKIKPHMADQGGKLLLQGSWCKGNRQREVPIRTEEQRHWLEQAKKFVASPERSLIPPHKSYIQHRYVYDKQLQRANIRSHGLRHAYAQQRYKELTGWDSPINSGPQYKALSYEQRRVDILARMTLTEELGHSRVQITRSYLG